MKLKLFRIVLGYESNGDGQGFRDAEKTFIRPATDLVAACQGLLKDFDDYNHRQNSRNARIISADELTGEFTCGELKTPIAPIG